MITHGDCLEVLATLPENSVDTCITDPPYGLGFMGKQWDTFDKSQFGIAGNEGENDLKVKKSFNVLPRYRKDGLQEFTFDWATEVYRVLKPGAILLAFGGTRTYHRIACAIEDAGFEIRDTIAWVYGSGFPKSYDISKGIDKRGGKSVGWFGEWLRSWREENGITQKEIAALFPSKTGGLTGCVANWELGFDMPTAEQFSKIVTAFDLPFETIEEAEREVVGSKSTNKTVYQRIGDSNISGDIDITAPSTPEAQLWHGWGTALKPAFEPIVVAMKPIDGTFVNNALTWGVAGLWIDGGRVELAGEWDKSTMGTFRHAYDDPNKTYDGTNGTVKFGGKNLRASREKAELGRFPANLILSYPEDEYELRDDVTPSQLMELARWFDENA